MASSDFPLTGPMLEAMLCVTRITSVKMRRALHDHLVLGCTQTAAAERYGYSKQQLSVHVKQIKQKLKPAFDAYATHVLVERSQ